jgi:hypothetical protein
MQNNISKLASHVTSYFVLFPLGVRLTSETDIAHIIKRRWGIRFFEQMRRN